MKYRCLAVSACLLLLSFLLCLSSCSYDEDRIIGKTSSEIEAEYGPFDYIYGESVADGSYCNAGCAYRTKEAHVGFFGTDPAEYYMIYFDAEGKACKVQYPWYVPGG